LIWTQEKDLGRSSTHETLLAMCSKSTSVSICSRPFHDQVYGMANFAILRTDKLKDMSTVRRSLKHAFRTQHTPNSDPARSGENMHLMAKSVDEAIHRINARLPVKRRKDAVLAIEYLVTASPEAMKGKSVAEQNAYFNDAIRWLAERHGAANIAYVGVHRDETTPHMYAYVVPIDPAGRLNCRHFLGGAKALTEMQTSFASAVGQKHGLLRGLEGSRAKHTSIQKWYARQQMLEDGMAATTYALAEMTRNQPAVQQRFISLMDEEIERLQASRLVEVEKMPSPSL
jgi:hypothetical protein